MTNLLINKKRTVMAAAITVAMGGLVPVQTVSALPMTFSWDGYFTMLTSGGAPLQNTDYPYNDFSGYRTEISGTLTYDPDTGEGSMTIGSFQFFSGLSPAEADQITLAAIGDGNGGAGDLILGNMLFNWSNNNGIPVSVVFDATGLLGAIGTMSVGDTVANVGSLPASNGISNNAYPIGAVPVATTGWNTTTVNCTPGGGTTGDCMGVAISGALPLLTGQTYAAGPLTGQKIGGSPMAAGPFEGFNANFDIASMTLLSDGTGASFTAPGNPNASVSGVPGDNVAVNLGTATGVTAPDSDPTCNVTIEYSTDGGNTWNPDDGATNTVNLTLTGAVTSVTVNWRATTTTGDPGTCNSDTQTFANQTVTLTIDDTTAPTFDSVPANFSVSLQSTAESVAFEGPTSTRGIVSASDDVTASPTIEWSLDGLNWTTETPGADESSNGFGSGANTVYWRATDELGNETVYQQTVTINLPAGIFGQPCTVDPELLNPAHGDRRLQGTFIMRNPAGTIVGEVDPFVIGSINPANVCADESCTTSGAQLSSPTPFYGNLWTTNTIRLFDQPGTYSFSTIQDGNPSLGMTVGSGQIGAHMLFDWSVNRDIDVVLVWNYGCGGSALVTTDPDGDGIIGTRMVDGPFKGFNASFDLRTADGERPLTTGGYSSTVPVVNNPVDGASPLLLGPGAVGTALGGVVFTAAELSAWGAADDSRVVRSCVGGCFDFSISGRTPRETIQVVLPLSQPIPWYALYRKYDAANDRWVSFVSNGTDSVKTASLNADGRCPEPGAGEYSSYSSGILAGMLRPDDQCVQLTITDNGPNDDDPTLGTIADPSGVGVTSAPATPEAATSGGGGCTLSAAPASQRFDLWLLAGMLGLLGLRRKLQR